MKWALISILLSGIWDTGLRYETYQECFELGVQASFKEILGQNKNQIELNGKTFVDRDIVNVIDWKKRNHEQATLCVPTN